MRSPSCPLSPRGEGWGEGGGLCKRAASATAVGPHPRPLPKGRGSHTSTEMAA